MQILVAKAHKRKRDERKDTVFIRGNNKISAERLDNFKRRKTTHVVEAVSPSAGKLMFEGRHHSFVGADL